MYNSFVEPPDLSSFMKLTLSIGDVVSLIAEVLRCSKELEKSKKVAAYRENLCGNYILFNMR